MTGTLYIVATPIGNLEDITLRALRVLRVATIVLAEDTRQARKLLSAHGIDPPELWSLHEHNEEQKIAAVLDRLRAGASVALTTDAGTPLVSDPGYPLARACAAEGVPIQPIPGPCAAVAALSASGLPPEPFTFAGFPPKKPARARQWLRARLRPPGTFILYAPARDLPSVTALIAEQHPAAEVVVARELTKVHESFYRGSAAELSLPDEARLGEAVLLVHLEAPQKGEAEEAALREDVKRLVGRGLSRRDAVLAVAELTGTPRNRVQAAANAMEKDQETR